MIMMPIVCVVVMIVMRVPAGWMLSAAALWLSMSTLWLSMSALWLSVSARLLAVETRRRFVPTGMPPGIRPAAAGAWWRKGECTSEGVHPPC